MSWHNDTCGCAECGNYGQRYNPRAIHNQSCGCAECGNDNFIPTSATQSEAAQSMLAATVDPTPCSAGTTAKKRRTVRVRKVIKKAAPAVEMILVPVELAAEVHALIAARMSAEPDGGLLG